MLGLKADHFYIKGSLKNKSIWKTKPCFIIIIIHHSWVEFGLIYIWIGSTINPDPCFCVVLAWSWNAIQIFIDSLLNIINLCLLLIALIHFDTIRMFYFAMDLSLRKWPRRFIGKWNKSSWSKYFVQKHIVSGLGIIYCRPFSALPERTWLFLINHV